jgi:hypothetical protein
MTAIAEGQHWMVRVGNRIKLTPRKIRRIHANNTVVLSASVPADGSGNGAEYSIGDVDFVRYLSSE